MMISLAFGIHRLLLSLLHSFFYIAFGSEYFLENRIFAILLHFFLFGPKIASFHVLLLLACKLSLFVMTNRVAEKISAWNHTLEVQAAESTTR